MYFWQRNVVIKEKEVFSIKFLINKVLNKVEYSRVHIFLKNRFFLQICMGIYASIVSYSKVKVIC